VRAPYEETSLEALREELRKLAGDQVPLPKLPDSIPWRSIAMLVYQRVDKHDDP